MQIVFVLFDRITALDAIGPYEVLSRLPGADVRFAGLAAGPYRTDRGIALVADHALADLRPEILVVPGGPGARAVNADPRLLDWLRQAHAGTRYTTSVCTGSLLLGAAGLLQGLEATTHWGYYEELAATGARPVARRVVEQGKIVTAAGVSAGIDMALTLAARIAGEEVAQAIQLGIEYDPQPPFDAGSPGRAPAGVLALARSRLSNRPAAAT
jgi:transcriptional regulator GlxA family with amidase domain